MRSRETYGPDHIDRAHDARLDEEYRRECALERAESIAIAAVQGIVSAGRWDGESIYRYDIVGDARPACGDLLVAADALETALWEADDDAAAEVALALEWLRQWGDA